MKKFLALCLAVLALPVRPAIAFYQDPEDVAGNEIGTAVLDLTVRSNAANFGPDADDLAPGETVSREIYAGKAAGSADLRHNVSYQFVSGNEEFCQQLDLKIWYYHYHGPFSGGDANRDSRLKYDGKLSALSNLSDADFTITHPDDQFDDNPSDGTEQWFHYEITVPSPLDPRFEGASCNFKMASAGWQTDFATPGTGFSDRSELDNSLTIDADNGRPTSQITSSFTQQTTANFDIDYDATDDSSVQKVELWYSHNFGAWQHFGDDTPHSPGKFTFTSPDGDGVYRFITVAVDGFNKVEDRDTNGENDNRNQTELDGVAVFLGANLFTVQVDTHPPTTVLNLGEFNADRFSVNEQLINGNFEDTGDPQKGWTFGGDGEHMVAQNAILGATAEVKSGDNSALVGWFNDIPGQNETDFTYQTKEITGNDATLSFWYRVISYDTVGNDWFEAKIVDPDNILPEEIILRTGSDEVGGWNGDSLWREATHSLASWLGETAGLWFGVTNHDTSSPLNTFALVDDVRVTNSDNFTTTDKNIDINAYDTGAGVNKTYYRVGGGTWQEYNGTFDLAGEGVSSGEEAKVEYYSQDAAGNTENVRQLDLKTDNSQSYFAVVLNQISSRPSGSQQGTSGLPLDGEWVDLYNNAASSADLSGWYLKDKEGNVLPINGNADNDGNLATTETLIAANGSLRVYRNGNAAFNLPGSGGKVEVYDSADNLIDSYAYGNTSLDDKTWRRTPDGTGTWSDPGQGKTGIVFNFVVPDAAPGLQNVVRLYNNLAKPEPEENPGEEKFQPIDIEGWKICRPDFGLSKYDPKSTDYQPEPTPDKCVEIKKEMNHDPKTADDRKLKLGPEEEITLIAGFDLDKTKGPVFLLDRDNAVKDNLEYKDNVVGMVWWRDPAGAGDWKSEIKTDLLTNFFNAKKSGDKAEVEIFGFDSGTNVEVETRYMADNTERGIFDSFAVNGEVMKKEYFLGSCSAGGNCTSDNNVSAITVTVGAPEGKPQESATKPAE